MTRILVGAALAWGAISCSAFAEPFVVEFKGTVLEFGGTVLELTLSVVDVVAVNDTGREIHIELPADILFDFDKATIRDAARPALEQAASIIRKYPRARIRIEGHTDSKGTDSYNMPLSQHRAEAVRAWLSDKANLRLASATVQGFAARRPAVSNTKPDGSDDTEGRQRNRRVEIIVSK